LHSSLEKHSLNNLAQSLVLEGLHEGATFK
jgi:hypothetical protein